jgi:outer membrane protein TolC
MRRCLTLLLCFYAVITSAQEMGEPLTLEATINQAIASDPWVNGSRFREDALNAESVSAASLPDPRISLNAANLPVDTFDTNQEAMTQLSVGISQMFPRGDSLALSSRQKRELANQEPLLRRDRIAKVRSTVTQLWLEAFKAQESIRLIEQDRSLFEQLVDAAMASYSSAVGRARQQDLVRAQLELTRIDDRLTVLRQQQETSHQRLSEWIGGQAYAVLSSKLPSLFAFDNDALTQDNGKTRSQKLYEQVRQHPALRALDQRIDAMQTGVDLARQKYKPEWGLSAQYGYRDEDPMGRDRADLFSVGVSFDLPLFTGNRQDKEVSAAVSRTEAIRTDKQLLARQLMADLDTAIAQLRRVNERFALYDKQLLPQMAEQAEASLTAYNNDDGDFAEAVRARIAELNAKIEALAIAVERQQVIARIHYLLEGNAATSQTIAE